MILRYHGQIRISADSKGYRKNKSEVENIGDPQISNSMLSTLHHLIPRYQSQITLYWAPRNFPRSLKVHINPSKTQIYYILSFQRRRQKFWKFWRILKSKIFHFLRRRRKFWKFMMADKPKIIKFGAKNWNFFRNSEIENRKYHKISKIGNRKSKGKKPRKSKNENRKSKFRNISARRYHCLDVPWSIFFFTSI